MDFRMQAHLNPRLKTMRQAMKWQLPEIATVAERLDTRFRRNETRLFSTEGASGGASWAPLSARYERWKRRVAPGKKILKLGPKLRGVRYKRGLQGKSLRGSLTQRGHKHHILRWYLIPRPTVVMGTQDDIAAHHVGTRDPIQMTAKQKKGLVQIVTDYMVNVKLKRVSRALRAWRAVGTRGGRL